MPLLLLRHASAGDRDSWEGDDAERPLDERGAAQARALVERLAAYDVTEILTSPAVRCVQTVAALAQARGLEPVLRPELGEALQDTEGTALVHSLAGRDVLVCGHGGLERALVDPPKWRKGAAFVVDSACRVDDVVEPG